MGVTFVTAFYLPQNLVYRDPAKYISLFEELASTGVPIILYLDNRLTDVGERLCKQYKNIQRCVYDTLDKSFVPEDVTLPVWRNKDKDTVDYMCIQLSKLRILAEVEQTVETDHLAWIDFGIYHMFNHKQLTRMWLNKIAYSSFNTEKILSPGCYTEGSKDLFNNLYWYHCGSFLLGPKGKFKPAYEEQMSIVTKNLPQITWEVNYWTMMEGYFTSYIANHNELLLEKVCDYICP